MIIKTRRLTFILLMVNVLLVGPFTFMTILLLPIQESSMLSSLTINNAFAQSTENEEVEKPDIVEADEEGAEKAEDNQDQSAGEADTQSSSELNDKAKDNQEEEEEQEEKIGPKMDEEDDGSGSTLIPPPPPPSPPETRGEEEEETHNHPPRADAGDDEEVNEGQEVTLSAKGTTDEDSDKLIFSWRQLMTSGSDELKLKGSKSSEVKFTAPYIERGHDNEDDAEIILRLELTTSDGELEDKDVIEIKVNDNERSEKSNKLQVEEITKGNKVDKNSNEDEGIEEGAHEDNARTADLKMELIGGQGNASTSLLPSQSMSGYRNNSEDILLGETTVKDSIRERQKGNVPEILGQKTNSSTSETESELQSSSSLSSLSSLSFRCGPMPINLIVIQGSRSSFMCNISNPTAYDIDLTISCSGLEEAGIDCLVQSDVTKSVVSVDKISNKTFPIIIVTGDPSTTPDIGSYPFLIIADCNNDLCKKAIDNNGSFEQTN